MVLKTISHDQIGEVVNFATRTGAFATAHGQLRYDPVHITALWRGLVEQGQGKGVGCFVGGELLGAIGWALSGGWYSDDPIVDVVFWATDPHSDKKTVGGKLLLAAMEEASQRGLPLQITLGPVTPVEVSWSLNRWGFKPQSLTYEWSPAHG